MKKLISCLLTLFLLLCPTSLAEEEREVRKSGDYSHNPQTAIKYYSDDVLENVFEILINSKHREMGFENAEWYSVFKIAVQGAPSWTAVEKSDLSKVRCCYAFVLNHSFGSGFDVHIKAVKYHKGGQDLILQLNESEFSSLFEVPPP